MPTLRTELTAKELAAELSRWAELYGRKPVPENTVRIWWERRARNGFPEPSGRRKDDTGRHRKPKVWNAATVIIWYLGYTPEKGGRRRTYTG